MIRIIFLIFLCYCHDLTAQISKDNPLYEEIMMYDSLLFEAGFNNCELDVLYRITDSSFEFYHDQSGITYGQENFVNGIKNNICSIEYRPLRKLVEESTEIHLLKNNGVLYGVIQNGEHEFYAVENNEEPYLTGTAMFTHLWIKKADGWILRYVLSYNHRTPDEL